MSMEEQATALTPDAVKEIEQRELSLRSEAELLQVNDLTSYSYANQIGKQVAAALKKVDEFCDPVIEAAHKTHKAAIDQKKKLAAPFEQIAAVIKVKMIAYYRAEQERIAQERKAAEEKARKEAEERALAEAQALQDAGMTEAAEAVLDAPVAVERVKTPEAPKADGTSYRETWSAEVISLMTLVKAVAEGKAPIAYLEANTQALNAAARAFKGTVEIPGVKIKKDIVMARRLS
jgi:hypothetical protein